MPANSVALVMAGGRGQRMRRSAVNQAKPLVEIRGVPLLERNLRMLLRYGFTRIVVAVPKELPEIGQFVNDRCKLLARAAGAAIEPLVECKPLGNIGCAGLLRDRAADVFVVYADNLTTLDLLAVFEAHLESKADLTLAVHDELFRVPFGRVQIDGSRVVSYEEKPSLRIPVCSAVSVLGQKALASLPMDRPTGLSELAQTMIATSKNVLAYRHTAPWIDVNDAESRLRAEQLLVRHEEAFDLWWPSVSLRRLALVVRGKGNVLFTTSEKSSSPELPCVDLAPSDVAEEIARGVSPQYGMRETTDWRHVGTFDDLDRSEQAIVRTTVLAADATPEQSCRGVWLPWVDDSTPRTDVPVASRRALAICADAFASAGP